VLEKTENRFGISNKIYYLKHITYKNKTVKNCVILLTSIKQNYFYYFQFKRLRSRKSKIEVTELKKKQPHSENSLEQKISGPKKGLPLTVAVEPKVRETFL
jgi:hypothetical protein